MICVRVCVSWLACTVLRRDGAAVRPSEAGCSHAMECQAAGWPTAKPNLWRLEGEQLSTEIQLPFPQSPGKRERELMSSLSCLHRDDKVIDLGGQTWRCASTPRQLKMKAKFQISLADINCQHSCFFIFLSFHNAHQPLPSGKGERGIRKGMGRE